MTRATSPGVSGSVAYCAAPPSPTRQNTRPSAPTACTADRAPSEGSAWNRWASESGRGRRWGAEAISRDRLRGETSMASLELMRHTLPSAETTSNHASFMSSDFRQDGNLQSSRSAGAGSLQDVRSSPVSRATCTKRDVAHATMSTEAASSGFIGALGEGRRAGRVVARHTHVQYM